jgi:uncharacterized protein YecE (DUF72 family)
VHRGTSLATTPLRPLHLGDRKGIAQITKTWDKTVVDRSAQLRTWVDYLQPVTRAICVPDERAGHRGVTIFVYANNHYAGHSPATITSFLRLWEKKGGA